MKLFSTDQLPVRLFNKIQVEPMTGCWLWIAAVTSRGYGSVKDQGVSRQAHLVVWEHFNGSLPDDAPELDHNWARGCASRLCCNPAHLEPVSRGENNRRSTCHLHPAFIANHVRKQLPDAA